LQVKELFSGEQQRNQQVVSYNYSQSKHKIHYGNVIVPLHKDNFKTGISGLPVLMSFTPKYANRRFLIFCTYLPFPVVVVS
jgi:hypothetical protein